jgi:histidinol-phosphate aminotransferase
MKKQAIQRILTVKPYQPGRPIDEVKREKGLKKVIKLASNENPFGPSPKVLKAIMKAAEDVNRYPDGGCYYLRSAVAKHLGVNGDQLIFGNGSDEVIVLAIHAFVEPGDGVIVSHPSFAVYAIGAKLAGADLKVIPMVDFRHDLKSMAAAVTQKTKLIFIDNPGNPSGGFVTAKELQEFLKNVPKDVVVFLDEAYYEYGRMESEYPDSLPWLDKYPNLIIARTFSKAYALAGLRVGYAVANPEMIDILNRVREPFNVNSIAQAAAVSALKDLPYYKRSLTVVQTGRVYLYEQIKKLGLTFVPSATNFILIDLGMESKTVADSLMAKGVIVRDMTPWGLKTFIRITIGLPEENQQCIKVLKKILM